MDDKEFKHTNNCYAFGTAVRVVCEERLLSIAVSCNKVEGPKSQALLTERAKSKYK